MRPRYAVVPAPNGEGYNNEWAEWFTCFIECQKTLISNDKYFWTHDAFTFLNGQLSGSRTKDRRDQATAPFCRSKINTHNAFLRPLCQQIFPNLLLWLGSHLKSVIAIAFVTEMGTS